MITVKSALPANRVAFWERHPAHPDGEIFIADDREHQVGDTAAVRAAIREGRLVEVQPRSFGQVEPPKSAKKGKK
jgi:hypothetical protein